MVDGSNVTVSFEADLQGQSAPVSYKGTVDEEGVWSGTLDIAGGLLTGTFKAKKK
jgi:bacillopeptidase F (M6 metalloprotease family)